MSLERLGWDASFEEAFTDHARAGLRPARVVLEYQGLYKLSDGEQEFLGEIAGKMRHEARSRADLPAVGDWVGYQPPPLSGGHAIIRALVPRRSKFSRNAAGDRSEEQIVAANVDTIFLLVSLDAQFNLRRIERYLTVAWQSGAAPVVVLTKADLVPDPEIYVEQVRQSAFGQPVVAISTRTGAGLEALEAYLEPGRTVALLGMSGAGKSTLTNRLLGAEIQKTQEVRERDAKGRHTTTHRELFVAPSGVIAIDTPGMRELQLWSAGENAFGAFEDIEELASQCRFSDCQHRTEPGCAVKAAIAEGRLDPRRVASYEKLKRESAAAARKHDPSVAAAHRREQRTHYKKMIPKK